MFSLLSPSASSVARCMRPSALSLPAAIIAASSAPTTAPASASARISAAVAQTRGTRSTASDSKTPWAAETDDALQQRLARTAAPGAAAEADVIREILWRRPYTATYDYLTPTHSHLLNLALWDALPPAAAVVAGDVSSAGGADGTAIDAFALPFAQRPHGDGRLPFMAHGHHLVYWPLQKPPALLMPDGTDPAHSPGPPFVRRMWAGGSLRFRRLDQLCLDGRRAVCVERLDPRSLRITGAPGHEKIFINVLRRYGPVPEAFDAPAADPHDIHDMELGIEAHPALDEQRTLVFMRANPPAVMRPAEEQGEGAARRTVKVPSQLVPDYSFALTPTPAMLFQFSALTYNAHAIHLDPQYCREVEGHPGRLVHGPLTLVLMLSAIRGALAADTAPGDRFHFRSIASLEYRNLAPMYAGEELRVCVQKRRDRPLGTQNAQLDVWVENHLGGLCVKGRAIIRGRPARAESGQEWEDDPNDQDELDKTGCPAELQGAT